MSEVIYADVLVVVNIYVTYFLLKSASIFSGVEADRLRLLLSSLAGGFYSLMIFLPEGFQMLVSVMRFFVIPLFIFIAFGFKGIKAFMRLCISFFSSSFIFAGMMLALWYFVCPKGMYFNGSVVYFDIDIFLLAVFTVVSYVFLKLFDRFFKKKAPLNTVFLCDVYLFGERVSIKAFLDTGNRLQDYFTDTPVIIADKSVFGKIANKDLTDSEALSLLGGRMIFCNSIGGDTFLPSFSPEKVHIKGADYDFFTDKVTVALTEVKILQGEYDAILPMGLFDNIFERKDEGESEKDFITV